MKHNLHVISLIVSIAFQFFNCFSNTLSSDLIPPRQGGFIVPYVWEIVFNVRLNLTIFKGYHFPRFYVLIWSNFRKIERKIFNSDPCFCSLLKLGTISPAAHFPNCVYISQTIAAIVHGFSKLLLENAS